MLADANFIDAREALEPIVRHLVSKFHTHLLPLERDRRFAYVFDLSDEPKEEDGEVVFATLKSLTGVARMFAQADFVFIVHGGSWESINEGCRRAILDHELCHLQIVKSESGDKLKLVRWHDVEEFTDVIARYGFWRKTALPFVKQVQMELKLTSGEARQRTPGESQVGEVIRDALATGHGISPHGAPNGETIASAEVAVREEGKATIPFLQRRFRWSYVFAASVMDELEKKGSVGPADEKGARPVLPLPK